MYRAILTTVLLLYPSAAKAAFIDFEDLVPGTEFSTGEMFVSGGLTFEVIETDPLGGVIQVVANPNAMGSNPVGGTGVAVGIGNRGLSFLLPPETQQVSMLVSIGSSLDILVNDLEVPITRGLPTVTVGEVTFSSRGINEIFLDGPIRSLVISGSELGIDNVSIVVPEPATIAILLAASISLLTTRRRQRA